MTETTLNPIPATANAGLIAGITVWHCLMLVALPLLLTQSLWWALLLPATIWMHNTHWGLIHEGIHKLLNPQTRTNEIMSRWLGILMGPSFHMLRFGHLMHHQMNRDWHSEWVHKPRSLYARASYYYHLLAGLYLTELGMSLLIAVLPRRAFLYLARHHLLKDYPHVVVAGERFFYQRGNIRVLRIDSALTVALYSAAAIHFGAYWPVLLAFIGLRAFTVSFLDNIYHYATPADNSKAGKELVLATGVSRLLLNGNYHETHHLNPHVPWTSLPETHASQNRVFDGSFLSHGLQQFKGPLPRTA
jgi:fatty acid desaturase